ncbi:ABC transporter permease [Methanoregula sp.]|uniref:ABC transporter permease n=1 Tax=Methanoregula sp. TaxID=2052170 RepID=UPI000CCA40C2|nr:ABC transporter permease [Methanoregula sp.]PKG32180.1 MAG: ABC transporter permease [Methanoregula sp.]
MIFWEIAKRNIRLHMLRSILAMLGIVIGVVAIASMGILGNSMVSSVSESLKSVGDSVIVTPYIGGEGMDEFDVGSSFGSRRLTNHNFQQIKRVSAPNKAIPVYSTSDHMKIGVGRKDIVAAIYALPSKDVPDIMKLNAGDYNNGNSGCLVGSTFAKDHKIKVGSRISIGTDGSKGTLRVTGIIKERGMSFDISTDSAIVVTDEWFENAYTRDKDYDQVVVKVREGDTATVKKKIEKQLNKRKDNKIVSVIDSKATLASIYATFGTITTFVTAIGAISMIVAGVSIFNIMMMSVNERIKEIGIMRSIGTQKKEVMSMFIYEAAIIGVIGSIAGGVLSIFAGWGVSALMLNTTKYLWTLPTALSVTQGIAFGILICLACGLYPAWQAANLNPIDALRHE